jgi:hypothetical protein
MATFFRCHAAVVSGQGFELDRVSAIWAYDFSGLPGVGRRESAAVYNPGAINPIPCQLLPAFLDYAAVDLVENGFTLRCEQGRLTQPAQVE